MSTIVAGRPDVTAFYNSSNVLVASTAARNASNTPGSGYDTLGRPTHQYDSRTGVTTTSYLSTTADVTASTTDPGNRTIRAGNEWLQREPFYPIQSLPGLSASPIARQLESRV